MNILKEGVKGAFVRIIRLFVYLLLFIVVAYIFGLITSKKASALVIKNTTKNITFTNGHTYSDTLANNVNSAWEVHEFYLQTPISSQADLIAFQLRNFSIKSFVNGSPNYYVDDCQAVSENQYGTNYNCSAHYDPTVTYYHGPDSYYRTYAQVIYNSGTMASCWSSGEYKDFIMCQNIPNDPIKSFMFVITMSNGPLTSVSYEYTIANFVMELNYDSTDIINSQGQIISQQQQTNQTLTDSTTTGSQTNGTTALNGIQNTMQSKLKGTNELTQMVLAPITILTTISGSSCQPITWNIPLVNYQATIPCMSTVYNQYFSGILTLFSTIITGVFAYRTVIKLVSTLKDCLDAENDKIEVIDL